MGSDQRERRLDPLRGPPVDSASLRAAQGPSGETGRSAGAPIGWRKRQPKGSEAPGGTGRQRGRKVTRPGRCPHAGEGRKVGTGGPQGAPQGEPSGGPSPGIHTGPQGPRGPVPEAPGAERLHGSHRWRRRREERREANHPPAIRTLRSGPRKARSTRARGADRNRTLRREGTEGLSGSAISPSPDRSRTARALPFVP